MDLTTAVINTVVDLDSVMTDSRGILSSIPTSWMLMIYWQLSRSAWIYRKWFLQGNQFDVVNPLTAEGVW